MIRSLRTKVVIAILAMLALILILTGFLIRTKYEATFANLAESRYDFVVRDLRAIVETGFNLQLSLREMANLNDAIKRVFSQDEQITSIKIFSADGTILYRAGTKDTNRLIPDAWWRAPRMATSRLWRVKETDGLVVGTDIISEFGTIAGGVALRAKGLVPGKAAERIGHELRVVGSSVFLIGGILAVIISLVVLRRSLHALDRSVGALKGLPGVVVKSRAELLARETANNAGAILEAMKRAGAEAGEAGSSAAGTDPEAPEDPNPSNTRKGRTS